MTGNQCNLPSMSTFLHDFKAAVQLNNLGIGLLQDGCYSQAVRTFRDGALLMKHASSGCRGTGTDSCIARGSRAMKTSGKSIDQQLNAPTASKKIPKVMITVLSENDSPTVVMASSYFSQNGPRSEPSFYCIRMEPIDFEIPSHQEIAVEYAILLYNYGIAYRCLSAGATSDSQFQKNEQRAMHLLRLSYYTLTSPNAACRCPMWNLMSRTLLATALILPNLIGIANRLKLFCQREKYLFLLGPLRGKIVGFSIMERRLPAVATAAAA